MANRSFSQYQYSMVKGRVTLFARVTIGATGAPTLTKWNPGTGTFTAAPTTGSGPYAIGCEGVKSITRISTGVYNLLLQDTYQRLLEFDVIFSNATGLPTTSPGLWTTGTDVRTLATGIKFTTINSSGAAADPASGDVMQIYADLQNAGVI